MLQFKPLQLQSDNYASANRQNALKMLDSAFKGMQGQTDDINNVLQKNIQIDAANNANKLALALSKSNNLEDIGNLVDYGTTFDGPMNLDALRAAEATNNKRVSDMLNNDFKQKMDINNYNFNVDKENRGYKKFGMEMSQADKQHDDNVALRKAGLAIRRQAAKDPGDKLVYFYNPDTNQGSYIPKRDVPGKSSEAKTQGELAIWYTKNNHPIPMRQDGSVDWIAARSFMSKSQENSNIINSMNKRERDDFITDIDSGSKQKHWKESFRVTGLKTKYLTRAGAEMVNKLIRDNPNPWFWNTGGSQSLRTIMRNPDYYDPSLNQSPKEMAYEALIKANS